MVTFTHYKWGLSISGRTCFTFKCWFPVTVLFLTKGVTMEKSVNIPDLFTHLAMDRIIVHIVQNYHEN
jgi:hypothetical protein